MVKTLERGAPEQYKYCLSMDFGGIDAILLAFATDVVRRDHRPLGTFQAQPFQYRLEYSRWTRSYRDFIHTDGVYCE
jgi:hypothetical protein